MSERITPGDEEIFFLPEGVVVESIDARPPPKEPPPIELPLDDFIERLHTCRYREEIVEMNGATQLPSPKSYAAQAYQLLLGDTMPPSPLIQGYSALSGSDRALVAEEFARESSIISGHGLSSTHVFVYRKKDTKAVQRRVYVDALFKEHVSLAQSVLGYQPDPNKFFPLNPIATNMAVCGHRRPHWRTGTRFDMRCKLPQAKLIQLILPVWIAMVEEGITFFRDRPEIEREMFAWACHDFEVCCEFFDVGNGRTARLDLQLIRIEQGLFPTLVWMNNMRFHERRYGNFREKVFIPYMRQLGYLGNGP